MNHPIIILDGPDGAGKTTWSNRYLALHGGRYLHNTYRKPDRRMFMFQIASLMLALKWSKEGPVIIDRHWPSEQIYAGVYRGGSGLKDQAQWMSRVLSLLGVSYVVCIPSSVEVAVKNHARLSESREEMYEADERFVQVVMAYHDWWHGTNLCRHDLGYCSGLSSRAVPMSTRTLAATLYQFDVDGTPNGLDAHVNLVHQKAQKYQLFGMQDSFSRKMVNNRDLLLRELGYN